MATTAGLPPYMLPGVSVHQPAHLEGDPTLATEILPGPPSLVSAQQSAQKRDPRKPSIAYSYLPPSDPGSTYSGIMHGTLIGHEEPRSKRSRNDKGATGRAQRASARNQTAMTLATEPTSSNENASGSGSQPIALDAGPSGSATGDEEAPLSRSNSLPSMQEVAPSNGSSKGKKKDKGKGKDPESLSVRVKEEPNSAVLPTPETASNLPNNHDHCSSCRSNGALIYCDGCPNAFHLWCLDPPMENIDESESRWFCPACVIRKHPPPKPASSLLSPLIHLVQTSIPTEFQLPDDIRNFFRDVNTGPKGNYVDASEAKPPKLNRHGLFEDRDPHRLRDKNGAAVLCFRCGVSALPTGLASTVPTTKRPRRAASKASTPESWKSVISCDYCELHWHLDCLDPPLSAMPPVNKKWMCPNHAERVLPSKRRIPKNNAPPVEISKPRQFNNGNIDIVQSEPPTAFVKPKVHVDEVMINGRRYRVPEKIVILDFWSKLNRQGNEDFRDMDTVSALSSPLTSLSSLDDLDDPMDSSSSRERLGDMQAAQLLVNFSSSSKGVSRPVVSKPVAQAQPANGLVNGNAAPSSSAPPKKTSVPKIPKIAKAQSAPSASSSNRPSRSAKQAASLRITTAMTSLGGMAESTAVTSEEPMSEDVPKKRPRAPKNSTATAKPSQSTSTRDTRTRSRNTTQDSVSSVSIVEHKTAPVLRLVDDSQNGESSSSASINGKKFRAVFVKREEVDTPLPLAASTSDQPPTATVTTPRRRPSRRSTAKGPDEQPKPDDTDAKEKRGRKRKARDEEPEAAPKKSTVSAGKRSRKDATETTKIRKKAPVTPVRPSGSTSTLTSSPDSTAPPTPIPRPPTTPSLKIRLPVRISSASKMPALSSVTNGADTPTRL